MKLIIYSITFVTLLFNSCSGLYQDAADDIDIKGIDKIKLNSIDVLGHSVNLSIFINIYNRNSFKITLYESKYEVFVNNNYLGNGIYERDQVIDNNSPTVIEYPLNTKIEDAMLNLLNGGYKLNYRVTGNMLLKAKGIKINVPFEVEEKKITIK